MNQSKANVGQGKAPRRVSPPILGKQLTSSKGCYEQINYPNRNDPNNENPKAFSTHDTTTAKYPADSPTTSNTNKEQTEFNYLLLVHQQQAVTHPRTHH